MSERKTVLFLTQNSPEDSATKAGSGVAIDSNLQAGRIKNDRRGVQNEPELFKQLKELLEKRGRGEKLLIFKSSDYTTLDSLKTVMASVSLGDRPMCMCRGPTYKPFITD